MNSEKEVLDLISAGEGQTVKFKRDISQRSDTAGELIAFANTTGGTLLVGVTDDGQVVGVQDPDGAMNAIANISRDNCRPSLYPIIERVDVSGKPVIAEEGNEFVVRLRAKIPPAQARQ